MAPPLHVVWAYKVLLGQRAYRTEGQSGEGWPQGQWERELDKEGRVVVSVKCQGAVTEAPNGGKAVAFNNEAVTDGLRRKRRTEVMVAIGVTGY